MGLGWGPQGLDEVSPGLVPGAGQEKEVRPPHQQALSPMLALCHTGGGRKASNRCQQLHAGLGAHRTHELHNLHSS